MKNTTEFQAKERDVFYESPEKILIDFFEPMQHPGHLVRRFHQICVAVFLHAAKDYTLTPVQFATLLAAEHYPGIDQTSISKIVALDRQTTSSVVTRLHERGLLEKVRKHKRTNAITITKKGKSLVFEMQSKVKSIDAIILGPLNPQEQIILLNLLKKLVNTNNELSRAPYGGVVE